MPTHSLTEVTVRSLNPGIRTMGHMTKLQQEGDRTRFASLLCHLTEKIHQLLAEPSIDHLSVDTVQDLSSVTLNN